LIICIVASIALYYILVVRRRPQSENSSNNLRRQSSRSRYGTMRPGSRTGSARGIGKRSLRTLRSPSNGTLRRSRAGETSYGVTPQGAGMQYSPPQYGQNGTYAPAQINDAVNNGTVNVRRPVVNAYDGNDNYMAVSKVQAYNDSVANM